MLSKLQRYDAIIFDMDGTLIDSMPSHLDAWKKTSEIHGFPYDRQWHHSLGGVSTERTAEMISDRYNLALDTNKVAETKRQSLEDIFQGPVLIEETYQVLLAAEGKKKLAVGTGALRGDALALLNEVGVLDRLDTLVTVTDVNNGKPHPETFLKAAEQMGIEPKRCLVFEDTELGRQAATSAGMDCVLVVNGQLQWPQ
ncbi:beta-phosphoglucomutase family hydrolase [uncultured Endozoicomonas sp.]|uniref:HAD family hydrolase n=1 Tax=uncultured Endozoicomonas sp. TaxID=432652 RepID=UPI0026274E05|nr:beta-phosphoglucomutase family hydrolase [uncultured Endozoicomonas sp.]